MQASNESTAGRQATAEERAAVFSGAQQALNPYLKDAKSATQTVSYVDPGAYQSGPAAQTLSGGDYNRLEASALASRMAPINSAIETRMKDINQSMADRGLYTSGLPDQEMNKAMKDTFLPAINQAGAEAANQRYGLQANELQGVNAFNQAGTQAQNTYGQARAQGANAFGLANTQAQNELAYRPADYWQSIYNQSGGSSSTGTKTSQPSAASGLVNNEFSSMGRGLKSFANLFSKW